MVKRIQCRVVHSVSLTGRPSCADPAEPSAGDPNIAKILSLIYSIKCSWLRKQLSNRNASPGLVIDFVA